MLKPLSRGLLVLLLILVSPHAATAGTLSVDETTLRSGLDTVPMLDSDPPAFRVRWIRWDSGFRGSGIAIGDRIVAIDGRPVERPADLRAAQEALPRMIGQYQESAGWFARGLADGATVELTVRRRAYGAEGWQSLAVKGVLRADRIHRNEKDRPLFGAGGPEVHGYDGYAEDWGTWYERRLFAWQGVLDGGWQGSLQSRRRLKEHLEDRERVEALAAKYPGEFADAVRIDFEAVRVSLEGRKYELGKEDLAYRELGEKRVAEVAAKGAEARKAFLAAREKDLIPAFPTVDPIREDYSDRVGRIVELPPIPPRDWVTDAGRPYLHCRGQGGNWFVDCESAPARRLFAALHRYRQRVSPGIREDCAVIGRIERDPRMIVIGGRAEKGLALEVLAATVGDKVFVDLTVEKDGVSPFAGEEDLAAAPSAAVAADATPRQVIEAMVAAVKAGEREAFLGLLSSWRTVSLESGVRCYPSDPTSRDAEWERSRRLILDKVCDARVVWIGDVRTVMKGDEFEGAPSIDEVDVEIEHVGLFDGEYRAFVDLDVRRLWVLQRLNGGPWRIASKQNL